MGCALPGEAVRLQIPGAGGQRCAWRAGARPISVMLHNGLRPAPGRLPRPNQHSIDGCRGRRFFACFSSLRPVKLCHREFCRGAGGETMPEIKKFRMLRRTAGARLCPDGDFGAEKGLRHVCLRFCAGRRAFLQSGGVSQNGKTDIFPAAAEKALPGAP